MAPLRRPVALVPGSIRGAALRYPGEAQHRDRYFSPYADAVLTDGPALYWRLGESAGAGTVADSSGNGRTGTPGPAITQGAPGLVSGDTDKAVTVAHSPEGDGQITSSYNPFVAATDRTFECWLVRNDTATNHDFMGGPVTAFARPTIMFLSGSNDINFDANAGGATITWTNAASVASLHHIVLVYRQSADLADLYVDGSLVASTSYGNDFAGGGANGNFTVGYSGSGGNNQFNGAIDEVAVYEFALSPARIAAHYAIGVPPAQSYQLTFNATVASAPSVAKQPGLIRSLTSSLTPSVVKQPQLPRSATVTLTASAVTRLIFAKLATATVNLTASAVKQSQLVRTVTEALTASVTKRPGLIRTATVNLTASAVKQPQLVRTVTASLTPTAIKRPGIVRAAVGALTAAATKQPQLPRTATVTTAPTVAKQPQLARAATVTTTGTVTRALAVARATTATVIASAVKQPRLARTATATITATVIRQIGVVRAALVALDRATTRQPQLTRTATVTAAPDATVRRLLVRVTAATVTTTATAIKAVQIVRAATVTTIASAVAQAIARAARRVPGLGRLARTSRGHYDTGIGGHDNNTTTGRLPGPSGGRIAE